VFLLPRLAAALGCASAVLLAAPTSPAAAHTDLVSSDPSSSAVVEGQPQRVRLTFSETIDPSLSAATLRVEGQAPVTLVLEEGDGATDLVAAVPPNVGERPDASSQRAGSTARWQVGYRVVSRDGHPVAGDVTFSVREASAPTNDTTASSDSGVDPAPESTADPVGGGSRGTSAAVMAAVLLFVVLLGWLALRRVGRHDDPGEPSQ
jgi:methionine-rich copper-binding protein CopC